jgi:hypothetical protein
MRKRVRPALWHGRHRRRYAAVVVALLAASGLGAGLASAAKSDRSSTARQDGTATVAVADAGTGPGTGTGPLTAAQQRQAADLARDSAPGAVNGRSATTPTRTPATGGTAEPGAPAERDVHGRAGAEVLDSTRLPLAKDAPAQPHVVAQVDLYDYATDSLLTRDVDLSTGQVTGTVRQRGVQPPPTADEVKQALALLLADPRLGAGLRTDYAAETGKTLTSPSQFAVQGLTYRTYANPASGGAPGGNPVAQCGAHRCVQLFVRVPGGKWIDTSRIVIDLSARRVAVIKL